MSKYYMFLKNNLIDFEKLIIDKYSFLGLDEVEVIILVKLHKLLSTGNKFSIDYHVVQKPGNSFQPRLVTKLIQKDMFTFIIHNLYPLSI